MNRITFEAKAITIEIVLETQTIKETRDNDRSKKGTITKRKIKNLEHIIIAATRAKQRIASISEEDVSPTTMLKHGEILRQLTAAGHHGAEHIHHHTNRRATDSL